MTTKPVRKRLKGRPVVVPPWWMECLRAEWKTLNETGWTGTRLAKELSERADRRLEEKQMGWDRKTVERFIEGKNPTHELVEAFCMVIPQLVMPFFVGRTKEEAIALRREAAKYDQQVIPEKQAQLAQLRQVRKGIEQSVERQIEPLESQDAGRAKRQRAVGSGRARGMG